MSESKRYVILRVIFLFLLLVAVAKMFAPSNKPANVIKREINLTLPPTAEILHINYNRLFSDGHITAKVRISKEDIYSVRKELINIFKQECHLEDDRSLPNLENISWWDLKKDNIICYYFDLIEGRKVLFLPHPKTQEMWVFVVNQDDGFYYLYIRS